MIKRAGAVFGLAIALLVVAPSTAPIQPTYATSGSMEPVISEGDLYVVLTYAAPEEGDVVTFYSSREGGYVTHRIVDRTETGFVTRGDANPSTDQETGHPPVDRSQVVGPVLAVGGQPVTLSGTGPFVLFLGENRVVLLGLAVAAVLLPELRELLDSTGRRSDRGVLRAGHVLRPLFAAAFALCLLLLAGAASTHPVTWVVVAGEVPGATALPLDEPATRTVDVHTHTTEFAEPFTTVLVEPEGMTVTERRREGSTVHLDAALPAVDSPGPYRTRVHVYPYPATLPRVLLERLHGIHWFVAALGSILPAFLPVWAIYHLWGGGGTVLRTPRSRWLRRYGGE